MKKLLSMLLVLVMLVGTTMISASADDEKPTLKFLIGAGFFDLDSDIGWEVCQRVSGYNIEFEVINGAEQLMLIIASGQAYDYCFLNKTNFNLMLGEGALMDITDLLKTHGSNITEAITTLWPATTVDGRIYAIPATAAQPMSLPNSMVARMDLLRAIGYDELPTTLDGFTKMLEDIKAAYPDMIPLAASQSWMMTNISSAFNLVGEYQLIDDKIVHLTDNPNLEAYMAYMQDLYSRGLLDAEMPAVTANDMRSKWSSSKAVIMYGGWGGVETPIGALRQLVPEMEYAVLPLLEDANGQVHAEVKFGATQYGAIPVTSEHPEEAMDAINNLIQIDNFTEIVLGIEGVHYTVTEDGAYLPIQPAFNEEKNNSNVFISGFYREDVYPKMWEGRLAKNADLQDVFYKYRSSLLDGGVISPIALAPAVTLVDNKTTLDSRVTDTLLAIVAGSKDLSELASLREYWNENGGDKIVEFYNDWYQAQ